MTSKTYQMIAQQVVNELYNANLYRQIGVQFDLLGLEGLATLYYQHGEEETGHGRKFLHYLADRGVQFKIREIPAVPDLSGATPLKLAQMTCEAERKTTKTLSSIADQAALERDHVSYAFLQWFLLEQIEEENNASKLEGQLQAENAVLEINEQYLAPT